MSDLTGNDYGARGLLAILKSMSGVPGYDDFLVEFLTEEKIERLPLAALAAVCVHQQRMIHWLEERIEKLEAKQ